MTQSITARWVPKGSRSWRFKSIPAEVHTYQSGNGRFAGVAYYGKALKPAWHCSFRDETRLERYVREWVTQKEEQESRKQAAQAAKSAWRHGYQVGDLLHYSWGYEQTQCEFFQVIESTEKSVTLQRISAETVPGSGYYNGDRRRACPGEFLGEPFRKVPQAPYDGQGQGYIRMDHGTASLTTAEETHHCSWGH